MVPERILCLDLSLKLPFWGREGAGKWQGPVCGVWATSAQETPPGLAFECLRSLLFGAWEGKAREKWFLFIIIIYLGCFPKKLCESMTQTKLYGGK